MANAADLRSRGLNVSTVVDCDVHVSHEAAEVKAEIASRMDEPYATHLQMQGANYGAYPRDSFPKDPIGEREESVNLDASTFASSPDELINGFYGSMDIDVTILNSLQKLDLIPEDRAMQEMPAVNDTLIDRFLEDHDRFYGLALLSTQRPDKAAEELDRLGDEDDIVGALIINGPSEKPLGNRRYDPIYRAAEDNDLPIVFHSATIGYTLNRKFPFFFNDIQKYCTLHTLAHPFAGMTTVASLVMNGVPEKFPDLNFVFLEMDLGIVPLLMYRMNREAREHAYDLSILDHSPEAYLRRQFYWGTQPLPEPEDMSHMKRMIELIGPDRIVFGSDHPHADFDNVGSVVRKYFGHLPEEDQQAILYRNASDVFDIGL